MLDPRIHAPRSAAALSLPIVFMLLVSCAASAQQPRKYELSAGYAHMRVDSSIGPLSLHGVSFSLARNLNSWLAIVGDGAGYHLEGFRLGTVQVGPRFTARTGHRASAFAQTLLGFAHANAGGRGFPAYHESLAWTIGGGLDCRLSGRVSLRVAEGGYVQTRLGSGLQHNLRLGAGIILHFGTFSSGIH